MDVKLGQKIKFAFGNRKEKLEGEVVRVFPKTVYLKVDFERGKGRIVRRKLHELE